ncbi:uncharacterized protein MELLADRAFT_94870 [Melampsora larici-populina 98AG31]|uniref:Uncharacterized protein n=1 Tax=Melampsora larici-populina (strain 98AG31 / pathotype 3-4-7) TaxID=747676 RepID=F4S880_MELLP|nr:uncharacterized protein MELLADRAFT_94870 [Melampsora larici-populina 98AG31]EGF99163.1 hypothetical protein MELLADRAFT_94870 [Melampsora larici-populina 98AG31]
MQSPEYSRTRTRFLAALGRLSTRSKSLTGEEGSADDSPVFVAPIVKSQPPYNHSSPTTSINETQSSSSQSSSLNIREKNFFSEPTILQQISTTQRRAHPRSVSLSRIKRPARLRSDTHTHQHYVRRAHHIEDDQGPQMNFINPFLAGPHLDFPMMYGNGVSPTNDTPQIMPEASPHSEGRRRAMSAALRLPKMMLPKTRAAQASSLSSGSCDHRTLSSTKSSPTIDNHGSVSFPKYTTKVSRTGGQGMQSPALGRGLESKVFPFPSHAERFDHIRQLLSDEESLFYAQDLISDSSQRETNPWSTTSTKALEFSANSGVGLDAKESDIYSEVTTSDTEACTFHAYSDNTPISCISTGRHLPLNRGPGIRLWATLASHAELCDYYQTISDDDGSVLDAEGYTPSISADEQLSPVFRSANTSPEAII